MVLAAVKRACSLVGNLTKTRAVVISKLWSKRRISIVTELRKQLKKGERRGREVEGMGERERGGGHLV